MKDECTVQSGVLDDPYTGAEIYFDRSDPAAVQIDHVVALSDAWQKGAQGLTKERRVELARFALRQAEDLAAGRQAWEAREAALPEWLRVRLATFRRRGGEKFELDGWRYELIVAELAALYAAAGMEETEEVTAYADAHGVTVNQGEVARMLARARLADDGDGWTAAGTVSALSPITGEPFYVKEPK